MDFRKVTGVGDFDYCTTALDAALPPSLLDSVGGHESLGRLMDWMSERLGTKRKRSARSWTTPSTLEYSGIGKKLMVLGCVEGGEGENVQ
ncbi:hypothetical protein PEBR_19641 [Penicillium brasilianum]|uniref:Uncharacterized protein n=2 Tax=Penicillium brasilianum TaxID=104259 RepID=A0A1S9RN18_PENBI|nr:hypothetical protein PEBR_19641 [Penicillium brasilianum]